MDMHSLDFPISLRLSTLAIKRSFTLNNSTGAPVGKVEVNPKMGSEECYISDHAGKRLYSIIGKGVLPLHGNEEITDSNGESIGRMRYHAITSMLSKARFDVTANDGSLFQIKENSLLLRWSRRVVEWADDWSDSWLDTFIDIAAGWVGNPTYTLRDDQGRKLASVKRLGSLLEGTFSIERTGYIQDQYSTLTLCALINVCLYECDSE